MPKVDLPRPAFETSFLLSSTIFWNILPNCKTCKKIQRIKNYQKSTNATITATFRLYFQHGSVFCAIWSAARSPVSCSKRRSAASSACDTFSNMLSRDWLRQCSCLNAKVSIVDSQGSIPTSCFFLASSSFLASSLDETSEHECFWCKVPLNLFSLCPLMAK